MVQIFIPQKLTSYNLGVSLPPHPTLELVVKYLPKPNNSY